MSGKVKIEAVGKGQLYNSIEDDLESSRLEIFLSNGYTVLIPGMDIEANANVKVYKSSTSPLIRAKFSVVLYDEYGNEMGSALDPSNLMGNLEYQLNEIIVNTGEWYRHTDSYYYYVGDNSTDGEDTLLKEIDVTARDKIIHFINEPFKFPDWVTSDYSGFRVKFVITFQAIQNYIPDNSGNRMTNTIANSQKIFSNLEDSKLTQTPLSYFDVKVVDGKKTLSVKEGVTLPDTVVLPTTDEDGNPITRLDSTFKDVKNLVVTSSYTSMEYQAFMNSGIQSIDLSRSQITSIPAQAFQNCSNLSKVTLPPQLETINANAFYGTSITNISLPDSVTSIGSYAFCVTKLTSIYIPASVTNIESAGLNTNRSLKSIKVDENNEYYKDDNGIAILSKDGKKFIMIAQGVSMNEYHMPEGVEEIINNAFYMHKNINNLYLPKTLKTIGKNAFAYLSYIQNIYVDDENTSFQVIDNNSWLLSFDGKVAYKYTNLKSEVNLNVPDSVETLTEGSVRNMENIRNITIGKNLKYNKDLTFTNNSYIMNISVHEDNEDYYVVDNMFIGIDSSGKHVLLRCANTHSSDVVTIPDGVSEIAMCAFGFYYGTNIHVIVPTSVQTCNTAFFYFSNKITSAEFLSTTPPTISSSFISGATYTPVVYVPDTALDTYSALSSLSKATILPSSQKDY